MSKGKVLVGMSGGVDSSVAAYLLKKQGYDVTGALCYYWSPPPVPGEEVVQNRCCSVESQVTARRVCQKIGISFYTMDLTKEFKKEIVDYFIDSYKKGDTPNPCVRCNREIKFGLFFEKASRLGFDYLATGHYARVKNEDGLFKLYKGNDPKKDQSYFLYNFNQEILSKVLFPIGGYEKEQVREIAEEAGLASASKKDSQGICFVKGKSHNEFLKKHGNIEPSPGKIHDENGEEIGEHSGLPFYTIGQRSGIGVGGSGPYFVVDRDFENNILHVTSHPSDPRLFTDSLLISEYNWVSGTSPQFPYTCGVKVRYMKTTLSATIVGIENNSVRIQFDEPVKCVMRGQSAVFFNGDEIIGGGIIE